METNVESRVKNIGLEIKSLSKQQQNLLNEYNELIENINEEKVFHENKNLKSKISILEDELGNIKSHFEKSLKENQELRYLIHEYIAQDKIKYLNISKDKLNLYFSKEAGKTFNELDLIELKIQKRIKEFNEYIRSGVNHNLNEFVIAHSDILTKLQEQIREYRNSIKDEKDKFNLDLKQDLDGLTDKKIDGVELKKYINRNSLELRFGSSWINKIGILFILIGVATAFKYTYSKWFTPVVKGYSFFGLGILFILAGEYFSRKRKTQFSLGFIGGGVGILYLSTFFCHFYLGTIGLNTVILFTCIVTGLSLFLCLRHKSQTICSLGLIGGNFPIITYFVNYPWNDASIITAMVYSCILNTVVLAFAYRFKWRIVNYISFFTSNIAMVFLTQMISLPVIGIIYSLVIFFIFNFLIILQIKTQQRNSSIGDIVVVTGNVLINSCIVYLLCLKLSGNIAGVYSACYSLFYLLFGLLTTQFIRHEKKISFIFFGASIVFAVLFIPLQFNIMWLSFGWLVEGVVFTLLALKLKNYKLQCCGLIIFAVALVIFYSNIEFYKVITCSGHFIADRYFFFKYSWTIIGEIVIIRGYIIYNRTSPLKYPFSKIFEVGKIFVLVSSYFYIQYYAFKLFNMVLPESCHLVTKEFFGNLLYLLILKVFIETVFRGKEFSTDTFRILRTALAAILLILSFSILCCKPIIYIGTSAYFLNYIGFILLIFANVISIASIYNELIFWKGKVLAAYRYFYIPEIISLISAVVMITALMVQLKLPFKSLILTTAMLLYGTINIYIGLKNHFVLLRRIGLAAVFISTAKLFLVDITFNNIEYKIISYFIFGIIFILISFIYQKTKTKFDKLIENNNLPADNENII